MILDLLKNFFIQPIIAVIGFIGCFVGIIFCIFKKDRAE